MKIGIDGSRAFLENRTGIEEYSYQVIKHLTRIIKDRQVVLYIRKNQESEIKNQEIFFPKNWKTKVINFSRLWTQVGLSLELLFHPIDVLFIPAHTIPLIHSNKTMVTIHGLEYEKFPRAYSFWERLYMRFSIKNSCRWASKIIAVSKNTKKDLMELYGVSEKKINVIYEGVNQETGTSEQESGGITKYKIPDTKYFLFIGRLEERKNIVGIISAFEILKEKYEIPHKLILAGKFGYGGKKIEEKINNSKYKNEIILPGFVSDEEKMPLMKNADVFLFPTLYEGFGLPILEAQSLGVPVVASNNSSIVEIVSKTISPLGRDVATYSSRQRGEWKWSFSPEPSPVRSTEHPLPITGEEDMSALLVDPKKSEEIAEATYKLISDQEFKNRMIEKGYENAKRFSWEKCAEEIAEILSKN